MAIDIRATTTCTLGTLISASISDDYIQGNGLIKTKGNCVISGTITPAIGTAVTFSYTKGGVTRTIPRKLRVLSSFADPFRRTTTVELGCKLTYLQDVQEPLKWDYTNDPDNSGITEDDVKIITAPISAASIAAECCTRLGIAGAPALSNSFSIAKFDFSAGYVSILSDLLVSECKVGYLDANEVLQTINLSAAGGTGPVITSAQIIDVGSIGVGQLPGDAVTVSYSTLKLVEPEQPADPAEADIAQKEKNWEREETIGARTTVQVSNPFYDSNPFPFAVPEFFEYEHTPRTVTETAYDTLDRVTTRTTTEYTILAAIAPSYLQHVSGLYMTETSQNPTIGSQEYTIINTETFTYKVMAPANIPKDEPPEGYQEVLNREQTTSEPCIKLFASTQIYDIAGQANVQFYYKDSNSQRFIASRIIETPEAGTTIASTPCTKSLVETYQANGYTQKGQQALASGLDRNRGNLDYYTIIAPIYLDAALVLESIGTETTINTGRDIGLQQRPSAADRINRANAKDGKYLRGLLGDLGVPATGLNTGSSENPDNAPDPDNGWRTASTSEVELAVGSPLATRRVTLSMPYAPDDTFVKIGSPPSVTYTSAPSDAPAKAKAYGVAQNKLLHGNRYGCNFQLAPETLPSAPFAPFIVQANGLSALYRNNGTSWTISADGVLVSTDALFWGAVGGTGTFWFPVAPGITTLPTTPPIVGGEMTVTTPVPVWNETVPLEGSLRLGVSVASLPYALALLTEPDPISLVLGVSVTSIVPVNIPATTIALAAPVPAVGAYITVRPPAAAIALDAPAPMVVTGVSVAAPASTVAVAAPAPTPGAFDPSFSSVSLLLHMNGTNSSTVFTDSSSNTFTVTANGNAQISTAQSQFGGASAIFDGTGDYLSVADANALDMESGDFTIEFWFRWNTTQTTSFPRLVSKGVYATTGTLEICLNPSNGNVFAIYGSGATTIGFGGATTANTWNHFAMARSGTTLRGFVNGVQGGSSPYTVSENFSNSTELRVATSQISESLAGYIDELRITKGVARYTANFTPTTVAFPDA